MPIDLAEYMIGFTGDVFGTTMPIGFAGDEM